MAATEAPTKADEDARPEIVMHEVTRGDTLTSVCALYNADMDVVRRANGIPSTSDYLGGTGRVIRVPDGCRTVLPPVQSEEERRAELLYRFALNHGLTPQDAGVYLRLAEWNEADAEDEFKALADFEDDTAPPACDDCRATADASTVSAGAVKVVPVPSATGNVAGDSARGAEMRKRHPLEPRFGVGV